MPDGAQAWKMIKPPGSQVGRIAQACDRCRSKKIRCDGKRPSCTQCQAVGFECRTSDKLSRRAFPRGYTESLEDHIRQLENENRILKEHLDIRDEQMELLSRVDSLSPGTSPLASTSSSRKRHHVGSRDSSPVATRNDSLLSNSSLESEDEEVFVVRELKTLNIDGSFEGNSSGRAFAEVFQEKVADKSGTLSTLVGSLFRTIDLSSSLPRYQFDESHSATIPSLPPRGIADQLVNFYFQDWHPLFPVLHGPTFLADYEKAYNASTLLGKEEFLVQLFLIFAIASRQVATSVDSQVTYERHWRRLLSTIEHRNSLTTLQSLVLAQIDMCTAGQYADMFQYKMKATGMALRLGLNRSHKHFNLNLLEGEMRLRIFWGVYKLDCFSSALLGVPVVLKDADIECAYASDVDDDCLTEKSILRAPPGSYTKLSVGIALSKFSRVLSKIVNTLYCPTRTRTNGRVIFALEDDLEDWRRELSPHLKFDMTNGTPRGSATTLHSRAPFLLLVYHYARILIHRPAIATEDSKTRGSASISAIVDSSKSIILLSHYLRSRNCSWTICMNESKTLLAAGLIVLFGAMDYPKDGSLVLETQRIMSRCLDGMYKRAGVPNNEYRVFESLCDSLVGGCRSRTGEASAGPAISKTEIPESVTPVDHDRYQRPSIAIPHFPSSGNQTPPEPVHAQDMDVLQWAISQHQQLEYRESSTQLEAAVTHHDAELENLFALMDSTSPVIPKQKILMGSATAEINRALSVSSVSSASTNCSLTSVNSQMPLDTDTSGDWNVWWEDLFSTPGGPGSDTTSGSSAPPSVTFEDSCDIVPSTTAAAALTPKEKLSPRSRQQTTASLLRSVKEEEWGGLGWTTEAEKA